MDNPEATPPSPERLAEIKEHAQALTYAPTRRAAMEVFAEIKRLRAALAYYAAPDHWKYGEVPGHVYAHDDAGCLARNALGMPQQIPADERLEIELECRRIMDEYANG